MSDIATIQALIRNNLIESVPGAFVVYPDQPELGAQASATVEMRVAGFQQAPAGTWVCTVLFEVRSDRQDVMLQITTHVLDFATNSDLDRAEITLTDGSILLPDAARSSVSMTTPLQSVQAEFDTEQGGPVRAGSTPSAPQTVHIAEIVGISSVQGIVPVPSPDPSVDPGDSRRLAGVTLEPGPIYIGPAPSNQLELGI